MGKKMQRRTTAGLGVAAGAGAALFFSLGNAPLAGAQPDDTAFTDLLSAQTDQFTAFSNNITDNLSTSVAGDSAIFGQYLDALPNVGNAAALNGLQEVSGQLNDQLANTNANDLNGFNAVLDANSDVFGNLGGGAGGTGGGGAVDTADVLAALQAAGFSSSDFSDGTTLTDVANALVDSDLNLSAGITGPEVNQVFDANGISFADVSSGSPAAIANAVDVADLGGGAGGGGVSDAAFNDILDAHTDQFTAFSNNLTDNLGVSAGADSAIFGQYLDALPDVGNAAALNGLQEVSGQLNDQLANTNANDVNGLQDVLGADSDIFGNLGGGAGGTGGGGTVDTADVLAALQAAGFTSSDFTDGTTLTDVANAFVNSDLNLAAGDVSGPEVAQVFDANGISFTDIAAGSNAGIANAIDVADFGGGAGGGGLTDTDLSDVLDAHTALFTALSNNLTDNLNAAGLGDVGIFSQYLDALPDVGNTAALNGLDEVSGQINDQLANSNAIDVSGFDDALGADFTNLGDFLGF
jgi:hypothetical protein